MASQPQGVKTMKTSIRVLLSVSVLLIAGCAHVAPQYGVSEDNLELMKSLRTSASKRIAVAPFTSQEPNKQSIMCRGAGPVEASDGKTFEAYLRDALITELKFAELFDEKSPSVLRGHLEHIDFNSNIGAGNWTMKVSFSSPGTEPFTVQHTYPFSTNFVGGIACGQVATALVPATQSFYRAVFNHPGFRRLLTDR
jgi:hypothetical protein